MSSLLLAPCFVLIQDKEGLYLIYYFMIWRQGNYFAVFKFFFGSLSNFPELTFILQPAPEKTFTTHFTNELVSSCSICPEEKLYLHRGLISVRAASV